MKKVCCLLIVTLLCAGFWHGSAGIVSGDTTFDPNQTDPNATLSVGNLITTTNCTGAPGCGSNGYFSTRSIANNSTGKFYNEFTWNSYGSCNLGVGNCVGQTIYGIGNSNAAEEMGFDSNNSIALFDNTTTFYANSAPAGGSLTTFQPVTIIDLAVDIDDKLIWERVAGGNWNGNASSNPANGASDCCGVSFSAITGPFYVYASTHDWSGIQITANFGATAYANTPPAGYANWTIPGNGGGNAPYVFNPNAVKAQPLVAALGVDTHLPTDITGPYSTISNVTTDMTYLGINLICDYGLDPYSANQSAYATVAAAGNKFDMEMASQRVGGCAPNAPATIASLLTTLIRLLHLSRLDRFY